MKFNQLQSKRQAPRRRAGRGIAAGRGKTAGRGTKGQKSRSGGNVRPFFAGGQVPLIRKLPKLPGFKSHRKPVSVIYTGQLDKIKTNSKVIDNHVLLRTGLVKDAFSCVKLIVKGSVESAHRLQIQGASKGAIAAVKKAGGEVVIVARPKRMRGDSLDSAKNVVKK